MFPLRVPFGLRVSALPPGVGSSQDAATANEPPLSAPVAAPAAAPGRVGSKQRPVSRRPAQGGLIFLAVRVFFFFFCLGGLGGLGGGWGGVWVGGFGLGGGVWVGGRFGLGGGGEVWVGVGGFIGMIM